MKKMKKTRRRVGRHLTNSPRSRQAKGAMRRETFGDKTRDIGSPDTETVRRQTVTRQKENVWQGFCNVVRMWLCVRKKDQGLISLHQHIIGCTVLPRAPPTVAWIISIFKSFWSHPCLYHYMHVIVFIIFSTSLLVPVLVWGQSSFCTKMWKTCQIRFLSKHITCTVLYF